MRTVLLAAGVLAGAGAVAWLLLRPSSGADLGAEAPARRVDATGAGAPAAAPPLAVEPAEDEPPEDGLAPAGWEGLRLPVAEEGGVLTGKEILEAVEKAGAIRIRADSPADLEALRAFRYPDHPRHHMLHSLVEPLLQEAGFEVERAGRALLIRRPPPEPTGPERPR